MGLVFLNVFDGHFRLFCHWVMTAEVAGPVVSPRPRPLPFLIMMRLKLADTACCDDVQHLFNSIKIADVTTGPLFGG